MRNVASVIRSHNIALLAKEKLPWRKCSCPAKTICPLQKQCLEDNIIYEGTVTKLDDQTERDYVGLTSTDWKSRRGVHRQGFNNRAHASRCELSKHIWTLKDGGSDYELKWRLYEKVKGRLVAGACKLCTSEKLRIVTYPAPERLLNSNWIQKCVHARKYLLAFFKPMQPNGLGSDTMD